MRAWCVIGVLFVFACDRDSKSTPPKLEPVFHKGGPSPAHDACPTPAGAGGAIVIGDDIWLVRTEMPLRWVDGDHLYELASTDPRHPIDLGPSDNFFGEDWDDRYWYRREVYRPPSPSGTYVDHSYTVSLVRYDRETRGRWSLSGATSGIGAFALVGDFVYYGVRSGYGPDGGVFRVSKLGGDADPIPRIGSDRIESFRVTSSGIIALGQLSVAWIPTRDPADVPRLVSNESARAADADNDAFYLADKRGVHSVERAYGLGTKLADQQAGAIAVFGPNVYYFVDQSGDMWSVPKGGGVPRVVLANGPRIADCDAATAMWTDDRGVFWLRELYGWFAVPGHGRLYFAPWAALTP